MFLDCFKHLFVNHLLVRFSLFTRLVFLHNKHTNQFTTHIQDTVNLFHNKQLLLGNNNTKTKKDESVARIEANKQTKSLLGNFKTKTIAAYLLFGLEDVPFFLLRSLLPFPAEINIVDVLRQFDIADVNFGLRCDDVTLTDTSQWTRVD